jgi:ATP-dependent exoDNAse (exonuclease V) beta subunit
MLKECFDWIDFNKKEHKYTYNNKPMVSVTQFLGKYDVFDMDTVLEKYCKKNNLDKDMVAEDWSLRGQYAGVRGSDIHFYIESFYKKYPYKLVSKSEKEVKQFHNFIKDFKFLKFVESEVIVGDEDYEIAGTFDALYQNNKGQYILIDWKTNKELDVRKKYNKFKAPFNDLYKDNISKFTLQLNFYQHLIERNTNMKIYKKVVVWFHEKNANYKLINIDNYNIEEKLSEL